MLVEPYIMEFEQLMLKCYMNESEENTVTRYLGGLRLFISKIVHLQLYWMLLDVQNLASR